MEYKVGDRIIVVKCRYNGIIEQDGTIKRLVGIGCIIEFVNKSNKQLTNKPRFCNMDDIKIDLQYYREDRLKQILDK